MNRKLLFIHSHLRVRVISLFALIWVLHTLFVVHKRFYPCHPSEADPVWAELRKTEIERDRDGGSGGLEVGNWWTDRVSVLHFSLFLHPELHQLTVPVKVCHDSQPVSTLNTKEVTLIRLLWSSQNCIWNSLFLRVFFTLLSLISVTQFPFFLLFFILCL